MRGNIHSIVMLLVVGLMIYSCTSTYQSEQPVINIQDRLQEKAKTIQRMKSNNTWKSCEEVAEQTDCIKALQWMQGNSQIDALIKMFRNDLEEAINLYDGHMLYHLGWGLTKSGKAYQLGLIYGKFYVTELSINEAIKARFEKNAIMCSNDAILESKKAEIIMYMKRNNRWKSCEDVSEFTDCMKALQWMQENNRWGTNAPLVESFRGDLDVANNLYQSNLTMLNSQLYPLQPTTSRFRPSHQLFCHKFNGLVFGERFEREDCTKQYPHIGKGEVRKATNP